MPTVIQHGKPIVCDGCVIEYTATFDAAEGTNNAYTNITVTPTGVVSTCSAHDGISDPATLHATVVAEMTPKILADKALNDAGARRLAWKVEEDRSISMIVDDTELSEAQSLALRNILGPIDNLSVTYRVIAS